MLLKLISFIDNSVVDPYKLCAHKNNNVTQELINIYLSYEYYKSIIIR